MYSHAYARVQSSNDSQVEHLIRYDQLYEYHEALALANRELCYVGSSSNADHRTFRTLQLLVVHSSMSLLLLNRMWKKTPTG